MEMATLKKAERLIISGCFLFHGLEDRLVTEIISDSRCELMEFEKGRVIFDAKRYKRCLGLVLKGDVNVAMNSTGEKRFVMNLLRAGSVFGAAAIFTDEPDYVSELTALTDCKIVFLPQELLTDVMRRDFTVAENYIRFLSGRVHFLNGKIKNLVSINTEQAVARYLLGNAREHDGRLIVKPGCSYSTLAEMLNMGRASLYRAVDAMENDGIIRKNGKAIEILDPEKLTEI